MYSLVLTKKSCGRVAARAFLAGIAGGVFCGALLSAAPAAADPGDLETARLVGGAPPDERPLAFLPTILTDADIARYRRIFAYQEQGKWGAADREIAKLRNRLLIGHVLGQRYLHPTKYRSSYTELKEWLDKYADHSDARRIHWLARHRKPSGAKAPRKPILGGNGAAAETTPAPPVTDQHGRALKRDDRRRLSQIKAEIRARIKRGWPTGAKRLLLTTDTRRLMNDLAYDRARTDIAAAYFYFNKDREALALADAATARPGPHLAEAGWAGGLAAWRLGDHASAARLFETVARAGDASNWTRASGAYWAARAHRAANRPKEAATWLKQAAAYPYTFYGLLARASLDQPVPFEWRVPAVTADQIALIQAETRGRRALALLQVGQRRRAEVELRAIDATDPAMARALIALGLAAHLPELALKTARRLEETSGIRVDTALYPVIDWEAEGGGRVDRALTHAFIRQESQFNPWAKSSAGARGLMQLMPRTAWAVARGTSYRGRRQHLFDPELNMALGERYLARLLKNAGVAGNLLLLAAAYNGGPGNLSRWKRQAVYRGDPLLFIESIPSRETRNFVERVLANLWVYRHQLGQPTPSLEALANGAWPTYDSLDGRIAPVAQHVSD